MNETRRNKVQAALLGEITRCHLCQPWDDGEIVWMGPNCYLCDLLSDEGIPDSEMDSALEGFSCPNCGASLEDSYSEVELKTTYDKKVESLFNTITADKIKKELQEFNEFLSEYPYLGATHKIGKKLFKAIKNGEEATFYGDEWFRARLLNHESRIFKDIEMHAPNPEKIYVREGRFIHTGQSFLYLAKYEDTAYSEIKQVDGNVAVMQKYIVGKNIGRILDLRCDYLDINVDADILCLAIIFNGLVTASPDDTSSWKPEYFVPRFVADSARYHNFDGIAFTSAVGYGDNLVIFNPLCKEISQEGDSFIFQESKEEHRILWSGNEL